MVYFLVHNCLFCFNFYQIICADSLHDGYFFVEFSRKFSDKSVSKSDFIRIINLHHMCARKSIHFLTDQKVKVASFQKVRFIF